MPNGDSGGISHMLTQKGPGGVPVWGYVVAVGAVGGGLIWWTNKRKPAPATDPSQAASSSASSMFPVPPVTYITGIPDSRTGLNSQNPGGVATPGGWKATTRGPIGGWPNIPISADTQGSTQIGNLPPNTQVTLANKGPVGGTWQGPGGSPASYYQVSVPGGGTGYVLAQDLINIGQGGLGGVDGLGGATPWQMFNQKWYAPQYILGGLGGGGVEEGMGAATAPVSKVASKANMPVSRLKSINPQLKSSGYRAGPSQLIRIA